jgi:hypothetical protein
MSFCTNAVVAVTASKRLWQPQREHAVPFHAGRIPESTVATLAIIGACGVRGTVGINAIHVKKLELTPLST